MNQGQLITLEGIDGAGKSTQLTWIKEFLQRRGITVITTREPGGTSLGEELRAILLDNNLTIHPETETLLMFAARREHLDKVILPALERGDWVVSDRFTDASFAYQGGGRQVKKIKLEVLEQWIQGRMQPDLTLYFDVPVELGRQRIGAINSTDRFEKEQGDFFNRVRAVYLQRAHEFPDRIYRIDASQSFNEVQAAIRRILETTLFSEPNA
ncbi:thymidylate kinase [Nitrosomonas cryotolerans]|uniref:Thymidylate kinase n=1 Tax=Nitrosomonas cryotolerans ATCC 49181 TaxID=1131553 RepID=A0A1N6IN81_9PROT|nr:dTMP kinase [Nitrosomonas cryotolerans]SFP36109.1 thymidylate kinase [Nitrosomonas cryotolerans]SIO33489.1 thymidylate kinase [Nitrosomonas cryotolerans ATCC 49181]